MFTNSLLSFTLEGQIGHGGEAQVYTAIDHQLNAQIVIKKIPKNNFPEMDRFFEEAKKLYITAHHNIVRILYGSQDGEFVYLALPYYTRGSLKNIVDGRFLTTREIIRYSLQFLSGVNNIHSKGLLHFDIKLENILIDDSDKALISDFGLAEYMGKYGFAQINGTTQVLAPPEFFAQGQHNVKFDIYQAGLTLYRMCNGDVEFFAQIDNAYLSRGNRSDDNLRNNIARGNFPSRSVYLPHIPASLRKVINKALKTSPDERYNSILEILNDLSRIELANDWLYSKTDGNERWEKRDYIVTCTYNGVDNNFTILAYKKIDVKIFIVGQKIIKKEAYELLYDCLNNVW